MKRGNALGIPLPEVMGTFGPRAVLSGLLPPSFHTNNHNPCSRNNSNSSSNNNSHKGSNHSRLSSSNKLSSNNNGTSSNNNNPGG